VNIFNICSIDNHLFTRSTGVHMDLVPDAREWERYVKWCIQWCDCSGGGFLGPLQDDEHGLCEDICDEYCEEQEDYVGEDY